MYENIGKKIKGLAQILFIVGAIAAAIIGMVLMIISTSFILLGVLTLFLGPILSWIGSWLLYGFGELIDKTCDIERNTRGASKEDNPSQTNAISDKIKTIEDLRSKGLITEEEYRRAISKIH